MCPALTPRRPARFTTISILRRPDAGGGLGPPAELRHKRMPSLRPADVPPLSGLPEEGYSIGMDSATTTPMSTPERPLALPNILTYARIAAVPVVVACMYWSVILRGGLWLRWAALAVFIAAAVTDILDGYFARAWGQQSKLGRMLDPIADKLLVSSCLLMLAADETIQ